MIALCTVLTDLPVQDFRSNLSDFSRLRGAEAVICECVVNECKVRNALKQVGLNKLLRVDSMPNEVYVRLLHMFVSILTDLFHSWFS